MSYAPHGTPPESKHANSRAVLNAAGDKSHLEGQRRPKQAADSEHPEHSVRIEIQARRRAF